MIIENLTTPNSPPLAGDNVTFTIGTETYTRIWDNELGFLLLSLISETDFNVISKVDFRGLFTLPEQLAIDSYESNTGLSDQQKSVIRTSLKNFDASEFIDLSSPNVRAYVLFLADVPLSGIPACNLITRPVADQILSRGFA